MSSTGRILIRKLDSSLETRALVARIGVAPSEEELKKKQRRRSWLITKLENPPSFSRPRVASGLAPFARHRITRRAGHDARAPLPRAVDVATETRAEPSSDGDATPSGASRPSLTSSRRGVIEKKKPRSARARDPRWGAGGRRASRPASTPSSRRASARSRARPREVRPRLDSPRPAVASRRPSPASVGFERRRRERNDSWSTSERPS